MPRNGHSLRAASDRRTAQTTDAAVLSTVLTVPLTVLTVLLTVLSPCASTLKLPGPYDGPYSYLAKCGYDGAGAVLNHMQVCDRVRAALSCAPTRVPCWVCLWVSSFGLGQRDRRG